MTLLDQAVGGSDHAWQRLVDLYGPLIFYWCRKGGVDGPDAGDVMQDVFARVAGGLDQFVSRPDSVGDRVQSFRGWVRVITRNCLIDHYRRVARRVDAAGGTAAHLQLQSLPADFDNEEPTDSDLVAESQLARRAVRLIQNEFQPQTWTAFWRSAIDGVPTKDVADELGVSKASVRQARSRVLRRLRAELGEE